MPNLENYLTGLNGLAAMKFMYYRLRNLRRWRHRLRWWLIENKNAEKFIAEVLASSLTLLTLVVSSLFLKSTSYSEALTIFKRSLPQITAGLLTILLLVAIFVSILKINARRARGLKRTLAGMFLRALDESFFNPHRLKKDSDEHKLNLTTV